MLLPRPDDVRASGASFGLAMTATAAESYSDAVSARLDAYVTLDRLAAEPARRDQPVTSARVPAPADNPTGGWVTRFELRTTESGPLSGRTVAVKQTIEIAGLPTQPGSPTVPHVAVAHASVVSRLLAAGATIVGQTAATDFEHDGAGVTGAGAAVDNPSAPGHLPAGSSSGSAAVVAAGEVDLAIGGDGGGSIREPASWCGCVGHKPTHDIVPSSGGYPFADGLADFGPMTTTVADAARVLSVIADGRRDYLAESTPSSRPVRLGVLREAFDVPGVSEPDVDATVRAAIDAAHRAGADVVTVSAPWHSDALAIWNVLAIEGTTRHLVTEARHREARPGTPFALRGAYAEALRADPGLLPPTVLTTVLTGLHIEADDARRRLGVAQEAAAELRRQYDAALETVDVLVMPTTPATAAPRREPRDLQDLLALAAGSFYNAAPFNASGHPALTLPCGRAAGLPVGLQLVGRHHEDAEVLRVGRWLEAVLDAPDGPRDGTMAGPPAFERMSS